MTLFLAMCMDLSMDPTIRLNDASGLSPQYIELAIILTTITVLYHASLVLLSGLI